MIPWHWLIPTFVLAFCLGSGLRHWADEVNAKHSKEQTGEKY